MFRFKSEPIDKQSVLEEGFALYKHTLSISLPYSALIALLTTLPFLFRFSNQATFYLLTLLCVLISFILSCALLFHLYCYCYHVPSSFAVSLMQAFVKFPSLIYLAMVYGIIILSGTMLLIVPGVILAFSLMFAFILVLTENEPLLQNLISSHRLVWGNWWHSFFIMSTPLLLDIILILAAFITIAEISSLNKLSLYTTACLLGVSNFIVQTFLLPLILSISLVLLHDLRQRKVLHYPPWN